MVKFKHMKIAICSSLDFADKFNELTQKLIELGHEVSLPQTFQKIMNNEASLSDIIKEKESGEFANRGIRQDSLRYHYGKIENSDAILIPNYEKKNIIGYIGGATFMEMGFAHVLNKKIFLLFDIPQMPYTDEIKMMQPIILNNDLSKISNY